MEQDTILQIGRTSAPKRGSWGRTSRGLGHGGGGDIPALTIYGSSLGQDGDGPHGHVLQVQDGGGLGSPAV